MNPKSAHSLSIFRDRPLHDATYTPAPLYCQEPTDFVEVLLRVLLVLCLISSMLLCGLRIGATSDDIQTTAPLFSSNAGAVEVTATGTAATPGPSQS